MARMLKSSFGTLFDLDGNVGSRGGNGRSDVGAVQYALLLLSSGANTPLGLSGGGLSVPGQGQIGVDGFYGPQTAAYIAAYQTQRVKSPGPSTGRLPNPDGNLGSFRQTPWNLNLLVSDIPSRSGNFLDLMRSDTRCPVFVRQSFLA
jgi:peptidoglycan hydrolase-like protein with peptidoglycan-binding domain